MWAQQDKEGSTALLLAVKKGLTSVVRKLLELGAKTELTDQVLLVCVYDAIQYTATIYDAVATTCTHPLNHLRARSYTGTHARAHTHTHDRAARCQF